MKQREKHDNDHCLSGLSKLLCTGGWFDGIVQVLLSDEIQAMSDLELLEERRVLASVGVNFAQLGAWTRTESGSFVPISAGTVGFLDQSAIEGPDTWYRGWGTANLPTSSSMGGRVAVSHAVLQFNYSFATTARRDKFTNLTFDLLGDTTAPMTTSVWNGLSPSAKFDRLGSGLDAQLGSNSLQNLSGSETVSFGLNAEAAEVLSSRYGSTVYFALRENVEGSDTTFSNDTSLVTVTSPRVVFYYASVPSLSSPSNGSSRPQRESATFTWSSDTSGTIAGAIAFRAQFCQSTSFSGPTLVTQTNLTSASTTFTPPDDGTWYWRVQAYRQGYDPNNLAYSSDWSSVRSFLATNDPPTASSLTATPSSAYRGDALTLTANNVWDDDGVPDDVYFYRDSNANGAWDSSDQQLGRDTDLNDGWRWQGTLDPSWGVGTQRFFARVLDDDDGWSNPVTTTATVLNRAPSVGGISISPSPVQQGAWLTLQAMSVSEPDLGDNVARVEFWRDSNLNGILDSGDEHLSPDDTSSSGGWSWTGPADWNTGRHRFFAKALDAHGSSEVSPPGDVDVVQPPTDQAPTISGALVASPGSLTINQSLILTANGVSDDNAIALVRFYRDGNSNDTLDSGDPALTPDDMSSTGGWTWSGTWQFAWGTGPRTLFARAQDTAGQWSNVVSTTVSVGSEPPPPGDTTPPNWTIPRMDAAFDTGISSSDGITSLTRPEFVWQRPDDTGNPPSGVSRYLWQIKLQWGGIYAGTLNTTADSVRLVPPVDLPPGRHDLFVRAFDAAGNGQMYNGNQHWSGVRFNIDTPAMPPPASTGLQVLAADDGGPSSTDGITWNSQPRFTWNQSADWGAGLSGRYAWQYKNAAGTIISGGITAIPDRTWRAPAMPDGTYFFFVRTEDLAGNWSPGWASARVVIDRAAPSTPVITAPLQSAVTGSPVALQWNGGTDSGSGLWGYQLLLQDEWGNDLSSLLRSSDQGNSYTRLTSWSLSLSAGRYRFAIKAVDWAGMHGLETPWRDFTVV